MEKSGTGSRGGRFMNFFGIDPGKTGAIAYIEDDHIIDQEQFEPVPTTTKGWAKNELNGDQIGAFIFRYHKAVNFAAIETFNPMTGNNRGATASLFHGSGIVEGLLLSAGIPRVRIPTAEWQRHYNVYSKHKRESIRVAQILYPEIGKLLIKQADIAEAVLVGHYANKYFIPRTKGENYVF